MFDYIIIGQGLAGSALAIRLIERGRRILVIDSPEHNNTSRIAAGLFNPITGRKMVKTWLADTLFPVLTDFYSEFEKKSGRKFFHPFPIYRPFLSIEEQNEWMSRSSEPGYQPYIDKVTSIPTINLVRDPFGGLMLRQGGFLNTTEFILAARETIQNAGTFIQEQVDLSGLKVESGKVTLGNYTARKLILCSGVHQNRWFGWLPIRPLKGETLSISSSFTEKSVINRGIYLVPQSEEGRWRVGATYQFHDQTMTVTESARAELLGKASELVDFDFHVVAQEWGMRPTTPDRRPILGAHPEFPDLLVFNGLGTKGVSLAPYFSEVLIHSMENTGSIHKDVDIERYKSLYSGSALSL